MRRFLEVGQYGIKPDDIVLKAEVAFSLFRRTPVNQIGVKTPRRQPAQQTALFVKVENIGPVDQ
jgi:hypothetical protein